MHRENESAIEKCDTLKSGRSYAESGTDYPGVGLDDLIRAWQGQYKLSGTDVQSIFVRSEDSKSSPEETFDVRSIILELIGLRLVTFCMCLNCGGVAMGNAMGKLYEAVSMRKAGGMASMFVNQLGCNNILSDILRGQETMNLAVAMHQSGAARAKEIPKELVDALCFLNLTPGTDDAYTSDENDLLDIVTKKTLPKSSSETSIVEQFDSWKQHGLLSVAASIATLWPPPEDGVLEKDTVQALAAALMAAANMVGDRECYNETVEILEGAGYNRSMWE